MKKNKKKNTPIYLLVSGGVLLLIAALVLLSQNSANVAAPELASLADSHEEETYPEIPRVSLEEARVALDGGTAVFLDVRDTDSYAASHMPGALNIPLAELQSRLGELDKAEWIITYCTWPSEESSARAARILLDNGFTNVSPILGGFKAWQQADYPFEEGR